MEWMAEKDEEEEEVEEEHPMKPSRCFHKSHCRPCHGH